MIDLANYNYELFNDEPVLFLDKIKVYPVKVKNIFEFNNALQCLLFDPMDYPDIEIATLPRLYFLTEWARRSSLPQEEYETWLRNNAQLYGLYKLLELLFSLVLDPSYKIALVNLNNIGYYSLRILINENDYVDIRPQDFEDLRHLILEQNSCTYSDEFVHNDIKQYIKEQSEQSKDTVTLEDSRDAFMVRLGYVNSRDIDEMTIRRYNRMSTMLSQREDYLMAKQAEMTGFVTFKTPIKHWIIIDNKPHDLEQFFKVID